jgi:hypothetical protein
MNGPIGIAGDPFCDWELPTEDAYRRLKEGWSGDSPSHWLRGEAGFSGRILSAFGYKKGSETTTASLLRGSRRS